MTPPLLQEDMQDPDLTPHWCRPSYARTWLTVRWSKTSHTLEEALEFVGKVAALNLGNIHQVVIEPSDYWRGDASGFRVEVTGTQKHADTPKSGSD